MYACIVLFLGLRARPEHPPGAELNLYLVLAGWSLDDPGHPPGEG